MKVEKIPMTEEDKVPMISVTSEDTIGFEKG